MSTPIQILSDDAAAVARSLAHSTEQAAHQGMDAVRSGADQLRVKSLHAKDITTHYIQHEPIKSVLMGAAMGVALMGLLALLSKHGGSGR